MNSFQEIFTAPQNFFVFFLYFLLFSLNDVTSASEQNKADYSVKAIAVLFRHGDRSPERLFPKDPYRNVSWFGGLGALSETGALMHYNKGKRFRRRYRTLIPKNGFYSAERMYVCSTDVERCLMSAQSFMAGFLPPTKKNTLLPVAWQPVPVNIIPRSLVASIEGETRCPRYDSTLWSNLSPNGSPLLEFISESHEFHEFIRNKTGLLSVSVLELLLLQDTLKVEQDAHLELPEWAQNLYSEILDPFVRIIFRRFSEAYVVKNLHGGAFLNDMATRLDDFMKGKTHVNVNIYSAHDTTLLTLFSTLEMLDQIPILPDYAATAVLQINENSELPGGNEVKILYYPNAYDDFIQLQIPQCKAPCPYETFRKFIEPKLVRNIEQVCRIESNNP